MTDGDSLLAGGINGGTEREPNKKYFDELVGDGKKFKDPEELAYGKWQSDTYISTLEKRLDEREADFRKLEAEHKAGQSIREYLDQLTQQRLDMNNHQQNVNQDSDNGTRFDPNEIKSLVSTSLREEMERRRQEENFTKVRAKLIERFGENYQSKVKQLIENDLQISENTFNELARNNPNLVFKALGVDQQQQQSNFTSPPRNQQRPITFAPTTEKRTWAWYQKMKSENPTLYRDPKTTVQMHKDHAELGDSFEDGDYHA